MINETILLRVFNNKTFGQKQSASIVGGMKRLNTLIEKGLVRVEKKSEYEHAKWYCNAWDVIKNAKCN